MKTENDQDVLELGANVQCRDFFHCFAIGLEPLTEYEFSFSREYASGTTRLARDSVTFTTMPPSPTVTDIVFYSTAFKTG